MGQAAQHHAQDETQGSRRSRRRLSTQSDQLQPHPDPETSGADGIGASEPTTPPGYGTDSPLTLKTTCSDLNRWKFPSLKRVFQQTARGSADEGASDPAEPTGPLRLQTLRS